MDSVRAQMLLLKCVGDQIWDVATCRQEGVPENWIGELCTAFESGFDHDRNTIYFRGKVTNQFEGVSDLELAFKLAEYLGIDWQRATASVISRRGKVKALQDELDEI